MLELEKRINDVPIGSDMGFTRPGPYIYEILAEIKITYDTVTMLIDTIDQATTLLEDGKLMVCPLQVLLKVWHVHSREQSDQVVSHNFFNFVLVV